MAFAALALAFSASIPADSFAVQVNHGSVPALIRALSDAALRPPLDQTTIVLNGTFRIRINDVIPSIRSDVTIRGGDSAATITAEENLPGPLFDIEGVGSLTLENLEFVDLLLPELGLIVNRGDLSVSRVQFKDVRGFFACVRFCVHTAGPIFYNQGDGTLRLDAVSFVDPGINGFPWYSEGGRAAVLYNRGDAEVLNTQLYMVAALYAAPFDNYGSLRMTNVSLYRNGLLGQGQPPRILFGPGAGSIAMSNSIVSGYSGEFCERVQSLGHNLVDAPDCAFNEAGDIIGQPARLIWVPVEVNWNPNGREVLSHALEPLADSPAVDSGNSVDCAAGSLFSAQRDALDGDGNGDTACDRGAVERQPSTLRAGGINGLYYNPAADGHYVYIAETTYNTLVMWTTFDASGNQAWIFGIGNDIRPNGRLVTEAYINLDGSVGLDGQIEPAESEHWGTLEVRMNDCDQGRVIFSSDMPGFGSGEFQIRRLAYVEQAECVEEQ